MKEKRDVFLLLLLLQLTKKVQGRTRFQKTVCLLKYKYQIPFSFNFKSYYYGPYSEELADTLSLLQGTNLVEEVSEPINEGIVRYSYKLTERGENIIKSTSSTADRKFLSKMKKDIEEIQKIRTPELIALAKKTGFAEAKETPESPVDYGLS
jgi:uncharacterized protein YwgA